MQMGQRDPAGPKTPFRFLTASRKARLTIIVLVVEFLLNLLVAVLKLVVGFATGTLSMIADGYHSALDGAANIVGFAGIVAATRPPDKNHPYGHGKFETLASMGIAVMLFFAAYEVIDQTIERLGSGGTPRVGPLSFAVMIGTMAMNGVVSFVEWKIGKRIGSQILLADSAHTRSDVFVSLSVILSLLAVKAGLPWADPVLAVVIAGFICYTGVKILFAGIMSVSDVAAVPSDEIRKVCLEFDQVRGVDQVRTRSHSDVIFLDLILRVDPSQTVEESHDLVDAVEAGIMRRFPEIRDIVIHVEPEGLPGRSPGRL